MLSYRHSFHAGNFADLIKHIVLVEALGHLIKKDTPFEYIDTHSGVGLYDLKSPSAQKLQEHAGGIGALAFEQYPELASYFDVIRSFNDSESVRYYPGSPSFAQYFLRKQDKGWLFELHPEDHRLLEKNFSHDRNIRVQHKDGFEGLNALVPPSCKRGLILIDPSYEVKSDYQLVIDRVIKAHKKFSNGIYAIWYPVVDRSIVSRMETSLLKSGIRNIHRYELGVAPDSDGRGMTSSGMILINPPWTLFDYMSHLLPRIAEDIKNTDQPVYKCDILSQE